MKDAVSRHRYAGKDAENHGRVGGWEMGEQMAVVIIHWAAGAHQCFLELKAPRLCSRSIRVVVVTCALVGAEAGLCTATGSQNDAP